VAAMSVFGTSRFTALLAAVALSGTAGTFWWALETRSDMKAAANNRAVNRTLPVKAVAGRTPRSKDEHPKVEAGKFDTSRPEPNNKEPNKFELMGKAELGKAELGKAELCKAELGKNDAGRNEPPQPSLVLGPGGRNDDADQAPSRSLAPELVNYPGPGAAPPGQASRGRADMPLPAMPTTSNPAPMALPWQVKAPEPPLAYASPIAAAPPSPVEAPKRQARDARPEPPAAAPAPRPPKQPSFYTEQFIEQGEFRYRRRPCEPPHMPDVCFMPQADRHPIVVAKP
jgi:hypothetical protein